MPRYFFNLRDSDGTLLDIEGSEQGDDAAAGAEAVRHARSLVVDDVRTRRDMPPGARIEITDQTRRIVATVTFAGSVSIDWRNDADR